jgi:itaconate CoA-transferase
VTQPLAGLVVLGLEQAVSAPYCTRQLADLGARVIKIESPSGDFARYYDDVVSGTGAHFAWANRGKESVVLDLKSARGRAALETLLGHADVLVQNLAPGAAQRMGLDAAAAVARHPRLVAVDISGYGDGGPRSNARAYDLLVQAEAGSCAVTGVAGQPAKPGIPIADIGTGMHAANAILAALLARATSGAGAAISVAMFDVATEWMSWALHQARHRRGGPVPIGMSSPMVAPYGAYRTADDQVIVLGTTNDGEWQRLATLVLDRADLAVDSRYATNSDRVRLRSELDDVIGAWIRDHRFDEISPRVDAASLGWARFNEPIDVLSHPQLVDRDRWQQTSVPGGSFPSLRPVADVSGWEREPTGVPALGEHTAAVLAEFTPAEPKPTAEPGEKGR